MSRITRMAIPVLAAGALLTLPVEAQDTRDTQAEPADLLLAEVTMRGPMTEDVLCALEVEGFQPPDCVPGEETFDDVPATSPFCPWIEELVRRGIRVGGGVGDDTLAGPFAVNGPIFPRTPFSGWGFRGAR